MNGLDKEKLNALRAIERVEMELNRLELIAEELEACMLAMDDLGVPRHDDDGVVYSVFGRAKVMASDCYIT